MKIVFSVQTRVVSTTSKRNFDCILPSGTVYLDFHCYLLLFINVIYLINCKRYTLHYVREADQRINEIFNWHKECFENPTKYGYFLILTDHVHKLVCKNAPYPVQILGKLDRNGSTTRGALDASIISKRKQRKKENMLRLPRVFQYELNDRLEEKFIKKIHVSFSRI